MGYLAAVLFILALIGLPMGFVAWPLAVRMNVRTAPRAQFRRVFWVHAVGIAVTTAVAAFAQQAGWLDAYLFVLPLYFVGLATLVADVAITSGGLRERG
jgi:hypothetical protein